jgi:hypothetical protein
MRCKGLVKMRVVIQGTTGRLTSRLIELNEVQQTGFPSS